MLFTVVNMLLLLSCGTTGSAEAAAEPESSAVAEKVTVRRAIPPFMASEGMVTVDGVIGEDEWADAVKYSLAYNQLDTQDMRPPKDQNDISGDWAVMYSGNMLYGYVLRTDDETFTGAANVWESDCVEVMLDFEGTFTQLRTLVGEEFGDGAFPCTAVWSADGTVLEYSVELPSELDGKMMGWALALADNDGDGRDYQLYPINGQNDSYTGANLGSLGFGGNAQGEANMVIPFKAMPSSGIVVDGMASDDEWADAVKYQFAYNQLDTTDETINRDYSDSYGDWGIVYEGNMLYGYVNRMDDIDVNTAANEWENDTVEVMLEIDGTFSQLRAVLGSGFGDGNFAGEAVWSEDGTVLEFSCDLGMPVTEFEILGFVIALADNDDGNVREGQYYPIYGFNDSYTGANLAELEIVK